MSETLLSDVILYNYWRSSAAYRVRIALALCGVEYEVVDVNLLEGAHKGESYHLLNPQGLVPTIELDGMLLTQSVAIIEYLAEMHPDQGLMPGNALDRQRVRALSHAIAMDIHPVCNLGVTQHITKTFGVGKDAVRDWFHHFIGQGLHAYEGMLLQQSDSKFSFGDSPTMADTCLMPQLYNARRWDVDLSTCERILAIEENCKQHPAFQAAHPDMFAPKG
ncbi:maleylacetoacetate isomerase [Maritalea porphyrae]|jgi:maleylacetoacetate isomerase|uniref:maleylacetoacetate isomerase n=1 Tax=Maritalea porphyrae TaxID=880732 RepID=UPI0022AF5A6F|nr:maleylacetoacetate isomerase [Maritalea porphyrae]MCZ4273830.1 maleylacetoacetate isomerase [Maritalea porphyrae]